MPGRLREGSLLLLDACCLLNLLATDRMEDILDRLPYEFATSRLVLNREVLTLARTGSPEAPLVREVISPERLERSASLTVLDLATEAEMNELVRLTAEMDDGEASVCALAVSRGGAVATDDRKALRVLDRRFPQIPTIQTPELLREWAHLAQVPHGEIVSILRAVQRRARFFPRRGAPRFEWWNSFFSWS